MAKAKRGKSGSASDLVRWDSELTKAPFCEDDWKPFIVFLVPSKSTDNHVISLLREVINTGVRKLFSVVEYASLLDEVKEMAVAQAKAGKASKVPAGRPPQFLEVCEQAKSFMDQGESISIHLLAMIVKFKMLLLKNKDMDRREAEKKLAAMDSKMRVESGGRNSKSSARKSQSPGKGKKGTKKEELPPSPKKDTQLKKRGEEADDFKTIDDEPDGVTDPQHYIVITGFTDASLLSHLIDMKVPIDVIINLETDYHIKFHSYVNDDPSRSESIDPLDSSQKFPEENEDDKLYEKKLTKFWEESNSLIESAPYGHQLHNVAKSNIFVGDDFLPDVEFDALDADKKNEFSTWVFNKLADICYDLLDYHQRYKVYLHNLNVIDVCAKSHLKPSVSPLLPTEGETGRQSADVSKAEYDPTKVDLRYYNHLLSNIPTEKDSVTLILDCLLEQVVAISDGGLQPMDIKPPIREDGLSHVLGDYLDKRLAHYGLSNKQNFWNDTPINNVSPHIVYHGDESGFRLFNSDVNALFNPVEIEKKWTNLHPYSIFRTYLESSYEEIIESCVRRRQFYNFCTQKNPISEETFERAMRQFIFESLPSGSIERFVKHPDACKDELKLSKVLHHWDDLSFDLLNSSSSTEVIKQSSENLAGALSSQNLDSYCCLEKFSPPVLLQVLDQANYLRPYLDTYYNRGNNTLLVVLQNPTNESLQNNTGWSSWLHSNVGFKNYLEYVAMEIDDWTREQENIEEEKNKAIIPEPETLLPVEPPAKDRSRWGLKTRAEILKEEEENDGDKRKKSGKKSPGVSPKKSTSKSPQKKKSDPKPRRSTSGKKSNTGKSSSSSVVTELTEERVVTPPADDKIYAFTGYNLGDNIVHVSGDQTYMFPQDGSLIKIERIKYVNNSNHVQVSVIKRNGDVFSLNLVNPLESIGLTKEESCESISSSVNSSMGTEEGNKELEEMTVSPDSTSLPTLPSLPNIPEKSCSYSNIRASFADGMILVCSNSMNSPIEKSQSFDSNVTAEQVDFAPAESGTQAKNTKLKKGKKEEDMKAQEVTEKLHAEMENSRRLQQRQHQIDAAFKLNVEQEALKNLYITTLNALHVSFLHHMGAIKSDPTLMKETTFVVKLENFGNERNDDSQESGEMVHELYRCVTEDGLVIQYLSNSTVKILSPNGDILHSTPFDTKPSLSKDTKEPTVDPPKSTGRSSVAKNKEQTEPVAHKPQNEEIIEQIDWFITYADGKQTILKSDKTYEVVDSLFISDAKCYDTNEILQMREDGVIIVKKPDGSKIVEYLDGTRISTYSENMGCNDSILGEYEGTNTSSSLNLIKIEQESLASVLVNKRDTSISVIYGNNKVVKGMKNGGYFVSKDGVNEMIIDKNGNASLYPKQQIDLLFDYSIELPPADMMDENSCILQQNSDNCLHLIDNAWNRFRVNLFGECNIEKNQNCTSREIILPRYFVVYPDGNGEELLQYEDICDYVGEAKKDARSALIKNAVGGENEAHAITIIKPYNGPPSKIWRTKKDLDCIIPKSLQERDFRLFPAEEKKKPGPRLGTRIAVPSKEIKEEICCPEILEMRHFIKYKELDPAVRQQILKDIGDYGEYVQQQQQFKESLSSREMRSDDEIEIAERIKQAYLKQKEGCQDDVSDYDQKLADKYVEAITPLPPTPVPHAQPKRSSVEWEKDRIELAELNHAKTVIRNKQFPPYFDTEEGQKFLLMNDVLVPDMEDLTNQLAFEMTNPPPRSASVPSTPTEILEIIHPIHTPTAASTPFVENNDSSLCLNQSTMSVRYDSGNSVATFNSFDGNNNSTRPFNPTPKQANGVSMIESYLDGPKLEAIAEAYFNKSMELQEKDKEMLKSLTHDVCGELRKHPVETPASIRGSRPNAIPNEKFNRIEEPVRRHVKTASIASTNNLKESTRLRGFVLIPDVVNFGVLKEGLGYSYEVTMKNVGVDTCRFKIKQPPPSTGIKVKYQPGPVAAGMSITFDIEIFAIAVGVDGFSGVGQVSHFVEIITETDLLYFPVNATIVTRNEDPSLTAFTPRGGPSKGTTVLTDRPSSRETLTRPRKE